MNLFPKSIRWRLQLWYGLILLLVLAGFGFTADRLERGRQLRQIDQELHQRISLLAAALRPPPREPGGPLGPGPGRGHGPGPGPGPGPDGDWRRPGPVRSGEGETLPPMDRPGDRPAERGLSEPGRRPPFVRRELRLSPEDASLFDRGEVSPFYYVIWVRDGRLLSQSAKAPKLVPQPEGREPGTLPATRTRGDLREAYLYWGPGECILVGRSIGPDVVEMGRRTGWLTLTGLGILVLGLAGGWWLASRAIRPVEVISATAARISGGDLSQRISLAETESELGRLAGVLNETFDRLEAAFAQQARFTSDAAHELRTPVAVLLTQTQMALARERSAPEYRETLEACQRAAQRMRRLIESLLALARLEAGQEPLRRAPFELSAAVRECVELVRPLAARRGIEIEVELPEMPAEGDVEQIGRVTTNLLTNAIQYNREGGRVWVRGRVVGEAGEWVEVSVEDTGPGIGPDELPHVFERFYRADPSRTGTANAGLGLAISRAIVEAHGGTIECISAKGSGATFTMRLPGRRPPSGGSGQAESGPYRGLC